MTRPTRRAPAELTIVGLTPVARDPQMVRIMVRAEGQSRARCAHVLMRDQAIQMRLRAGSRWSASAQARVARMAAVNSARDDALKAIARARRDLTPGDLAARLARAGHAPGIIDAAIAQMRTDGWISDRIRAT
jgi:hypothetical protein